MRKKLLSGVLAAAVMALVGIQGTNVAAQPQTRTFTIYIHFEYVGGVNYEYPLRSGVSISEMTSWLQYCGSAHQLPDVVRYYCYPVPD